MKFKRKIKNSNKIDEINLLSRIEKLEDFEEDKKDKVKIPNFLKKEYEKTMTEFIKVLEIDMDNLKENDEFILGYEEFLHELDDERECDEYDKHNE